VTSSYAKDPDAVLDYEVDWAGPAAEDGPWLQTGETISTSIWVVPTGIVQNSASSTTTTATIWLSGGTAGTTYEVTNRVVTNQGRTNDHTIRVWVTNE
jgi:hypothetical protein